MPIEIGGLAAGVVTAAIAGHAATSAVVRARQHVRDAGKTTEETRES